MSGPEDGNQFPDFRCDDAACERGEEPCRKHAPGEAVDTNLISDGYHTFGELYDHRITLFLALCRTRTDAWKSRVHADGTSWPGWFLVCIGRAPGTQISYHLPDARWDEATMPEIEPPTFDGHTPADVLERLKKL